MKRYSIRRIFSFASTSTPDRMPFAVALILIISAFFMVGGGRDDLSSLLIWRPLSAFLLMLAIAQYGLEAWRNGRALLLFCAAVLGLVALHLVPLPPAIWTALPGRDFLVNIYESAGMALPWQPLSMAQARTWNALFSLAGPLAVIVVVLVLEKRRHQQLLLLLLGVGFLSGVIGMIQAIGPSNGLLYFYRITNIGTSVGFFANRNHQAILLATMYPLLAANLSLFKGRPDRLFFYRSITIAGGGLLIPLILMTGSRGGLVLMVVGLAAAWWVYKAPVATGRVVGIRSEHRSRLIGVGLAVVLSLASIIVLVSTPALQRLLETDAASELRVQALPSILEATQRFFPFGSGIGTFVETYQIFEPDALISTSYFNHAHNDLAEIVMTGGIPALVLATWAVVLGVLTFIALMRRRAVRPSDADFLFHIMGRAGLAVLAMLALASFADYPLRVPSLMLYAAVAAAWCSNAYRLGRK
ncbi:O-antigen ligase family protein [Sphingobium boeckii]|uniref:O-antigen ligase n=1 Tax=Sphingobium boeckii TaxID=1082345 RepID=A0A7W9AHF0_9SPHN|nr:O-antigen ligase family protein [Sphingobium boeckii]MBB5685747.1 O-antigen ligase [Sphingobium boeckii]